MHAANICFSFRNKSPTGLMLSTVRYSDTQHEKNSMSIVNVYVYNISGNMIKKETIRDKLVNELYTIKGQLNQILSIDYIVYQKLLVF